MADLEPEAYSGPCVTLAYLEPKPEPEAYSEPWHIQKLGVLRILAYSEPEAFSEPCQTSLMEFLQK